MLIGEIETITFLVSALVVLALSVVVLLFTFLKLRKQVAINGELTEKNTEIELTCKQQNELDQQALMDRELQLAKLQTVIEQQEKQLKLHQNKLEQFDTLKERFIQVQTQNDEKERQLKSQTLMLHEAKTALLKEFELAANKLFEEKQSRFSQLSKQNMEAILDPVKHQLNRFNKQVEDVYDKENAQRNQLIGQIGELQKQTQRISADANNLASALKGDNRIQGSWGEIVLERLLEQSGLAKGREFNVQKTYKSAEGKSYRPDVVIHLPGEKDIVIDSKVALIDYERFVSCDEGESKTQYLKKHVDAIRTHLKSLSYKEYQGLQGIRSLDFVFMFIPIDAAYIAAIHHSPSMFDEAYEKKVILVSPSSLMVALRTVETLWRNEKQSANAEKIAISAGRLYDQFVLFMTALDDVGGYIQKAHESHELALKRLSEGRGNILKRIEDLKKLGVNPSKVLSKNIQNAVQTDDVSAELDN